MSILKIFLSLSYLLSHGHWKLHLLTFSDSHLIPASLKNAQHPCSSLTLVAYATSPYKTITLVTASAVITDILLKFPPSLEAWTLGSWLLSFPLFLLPPAMT